jgi:tyrosine-protein phosphatase SIW14
MTPIREMYRLRSAVSVAAVLSALSAPPQVAEARQARTATQSGKPFACVAAEASGIPRFAIIEAGLARGGQPSNEGLRYLKEQGYRTVISFREGSPERREAERMGFHYVEIPIRSGPFSATPPTDDQVQQFLSVVSDSSARPVFIHCLRGRDRTGAMAAVYRIHSCHWSADEAVEEMKALGFRGHYKKLLQFVRYWSPTSKKSEALTTATPAAP